MRSRRRSARDITLSLPPSTVSFWQYESAGVRAAGLGPAAQDRRGLAVHRKEAFDAQLLQRDVLRRAEGGDGGEQFQGDVTLAKMHRQDRGRDSLHGSGPQESAHTLVAQQSLQQRRVSRWAAGGGGVSGGGNEGARAFFQCEKDRQNPGGPKRASQNFAFPGGGGGPTKNPPKPPPPAIGLEQVPVPVDRHCR